MLLPGGTLVFGGLGTLLGVLPALAAGALATFLLVAAVTMHDFRAIEDPEKQQTEMTQFLENVSGAGAALLFLALSGAT